ncbi:toxic anion resistance protein [Peribacillus deserti]|uniref:Toxic anion resistance protein n=1 Tax=Peribacillus deserti TaxID=673318 RepID=A0A2N5MC03_9BACI|nr:toxic anion resistance protein [Peribacillus deserti]PLT31884.1 toxic anion resistance protein [Peribacillus deserti]
MKEKAGDYLDGRYKLLFPAEGLTRDSKAMPSEFGYIQKADPDDLESQIEIRNHQSILSFGLTVQSKLVQISNAMLKNVQKKDVGEIGDIILELMKKLSEVDPEELKLSRPSVFGRLLGRKPRPIQEVLSRFQKAGAAIDRLSIKLDRSKEILLMDFTDLEKLYESNLVYFHHLDAYITAGETKLKDLLQKTIPDLQSSAGNADHPIKKQEISDFHQFAELLDKRLYDLKISRELSLQSAAQIRMIQHSNQVLAEKVQSSIMTVIPLWKNQISTAVNMLRQLQSSDAQKRGGVSDEVPLSVTSLKNIHETLLFQLKETLNVQEDERAKLDRAEMDLAELGKGVDKDTSII